eukprot:1629221-Amphidinium_carterae.1
MVCHRTHVRYGVDLVKKDRIHIPSLFFAGTRSMLHQQLSGSDVFPEIDSFAFCVPCRLCLCM